MLQRQHHLLSMCFAEDLLWPGSFCVVVHGASHAARVLPTRETCSTCTRYCISAAARSALSRPAVAPRHRMSSRNLFELGYDDKLQVFSAAKDYNILIAGQRPPLVLEHVLQERWHRLQVHVLQPSHIAIATAVHSF